MLVNFFLIREFSKKGNHGLRGTLFHTKQNTKINDILRSPLKCRVMCSLIKI